jgi:DNA-directed RNA polymerase specialized sigma24 family protein
MSLVDSDSWNLDDLSKRCAEESKRFFQGRDNDPRFCFELFRRAIFDQDELAWNCVYQQYQPLVAGWIEKHALFPSLSEEKEYFTNRSFEKMWKSLSPAKFLQFSALNGLLHYLKMCVASVIIDHARTQKRYQVEELVERGHNETNTDSPPSDSLEDLTLQRIQSQELWNQVKALATNRKEYYVIAGSFMLGLKPREVFESYQGEFKDVQEVYRVKENLIDRLRRNQGLLEYLANYAGANASK